MIIAIDGPATSGKSARWMANELLKRLLYSFTDDRFHSFFARNTKRCIEQLQSRGTDHNRTFLFRSSGAARP
jgi:cytidylate kinase